MLCMNMKWFVEITKGISIRISFNDDQDEAAGIWRSKSIESLHDFRKAVAIRILHRVMENILKEKYSVIRIDPILSEIVDTLVDPIPEALQLVRYVLNAPHETKILLAVDEIAKTTNEKTNLFSKDNL